MKKGNLLCNLILLILFLNKCTDPISSPPDIPIETLLSAPDTLIIENQKLILSTYLWRDFQPISPPDGKPLTALIYVETVDSSVISSLIDVDAVYINYNGQVWKSFINEEQPPVELKPFRITKIVHNGPKWGPNVKVDVIVRITLGNKYFLLRASGQYIGRTD